MAIIIATCTQVDGLKSVGKSIPFKLWQHFKNIYLSLILGKQLTEVKAHFGCGPI